VSPREQGNDRHSCDYSAREGNGLFSQKQEIEMNIVKTLELTDELRHDDLDAVNGSEGVPTNEGVAIPGTGIILWYNGYGRLDGWSSSLDNHVVDHKFPR
jgi:hypothetical protein